MGSDKHESKEEHGHGHGHDHVNEEHGHGHGHGHEERNPYPVQLPPFHKIPRPQVGSEEYVNEIVAFDTSKPLPPPRNAFETFRDLIHRGSGLNEGSELNPGISGNPRQVQYDSFFEKLIRPWYPLRPSTYVDPYLRPNPCPERFHQLDHKWANVKMVNPKIPPPLDGKYNDYYHYLAFKNWFARERDVYISHMHLVQMAVTRCWLREGKFNAPKNCKHLASKHFAMRRQEELTQNFLYMAQTGNCAIRETPYPDDFVEQKRKIYDDWLFRTRMRKPGDVA
jgi:hypothetical protein